MASSIKTINGAALANIKTINGVHYNGPLEQTRFFVPSIDADLVGYFKLDDANDSSGHDYNLTNINSVGFAAGLFGNCADFGTNNTSKFLSKYAATGISDAMSISFRIKMRAELASGTKYVIGACGSQGVEFYIMYDYNGGTRRLQLVRNGKNTMNYNITLGTSNWYHIVAKYDGSNIRLNVNGAAAGSPVASTGTSGEGQCMKIGGNGVSYISAYIDDVSVWKRSLSDADCAYIYGGGIKAIDGVSNV